MSGPPPPHHQPWTNAEKWDLVIEILKASSYAPENMQHVFRQLPIPPWEDLALPRGRSLNQCRIFYQDFLNADFRMPPQQAMLTQSRPPSLDLSADARRPYAVEGPSSAPGSGPSSAPPTGQVPIVTHFAHIQPKPPGAMVTMNLDQAEPPRKKRGRPTKAESELRKEAARARGETFYPLRRDAHHAPSQAAPSLAAQQAAQAAMVPPYAGQSQPPPPIQPQTLQQHHARSHSQSFSQPHVPPHSRSQPPPQLPPPSDRPSSSSHHRSYSHGRRESSHFLDTRPEKRKRSRSRSEPRAGCIREEHEPESSHGSHHGQHPSTRNVDILSQNPEDMPSSFRAPRS